MPTAPTPTTALPKAALDVSFGPLTLGDRLATVGEFDVPAGLGTPVSPLTAAAKEMVAADASLTGNLTKLADLVRQSPSGAIDRISIAPEFESFHGARAAAWMAATGARDAATAERMLVRALSGANRFVEGEYVPGARHLLLGPVASSGVLGKLSGASPNVTTRPGYVVAHEIAHARQPITPVEIGDEAVRTTEEARADLVARWSGLSSTVSAITGLTIDPSLLAADQTYAAHRESLEQRLARAGASPGAQTAAWLDATRAADIVAQIGD